MAVDLQYHDGTHNARVEPWLDATTGRPFGIGYSRLSLNPASGVIMARISDGFAYDGLRRHMWSFVYHLRCALGQALVPRYMSGLRPPDHVRQSHLFGQMFEYHLHPGRLVVKFHDQRQIQGKVDQRRRVYFSIGAETGDGAKYRDARNVLLIMKEIHDFGQQMLALAEVNPRYRDRLSCHIHFPTKVPNQTATTPNTALMAKMLNKP